MLPNCAVAVSSGLSQMLRKSANFRWHERCESGGGRTRLRALPLRVADDSVPGFHSLALKEETAMRASRNEGIKLTFSQKLSRFHERMHETQWRKYFATLMLG